MTQQSPTLPSPRLVEIAEHVFVYLQPDGGWCLNNAGVIVSGGQVALVDTAATEARARALRQAVARIAPQPPAYVLNTHPHGDHTFGNFVFAGDAVVVAHERTRDEMAVAGLHLTGLWPDVRWGNLAVELPSFTFSAAATVHVGEVPVRMLHLGVAHTTNDSVVWLPEQGVLFTGDIVMSGATPFCLTGSIAGSLEVIGRLRALRPRTVVSGHGPVGGVELFDTAEDYLRTVQRIAAEGIAAGLTPLAAAREADLGEYAGLLDAERLVPNLHRAYAEAQGAPPGHPLDIGLLFAEMVEFNGGLPTCHA